MDGVGGGEGFGTGPGFLLQHRDARHCFFQDLVRVSWPFGRPAGSRHLFVARVVCHSSRRFAGVLFSFVATPGGALFVGGRRDLRARRNNGCLSTSSELRAERSSSAAVEAIARDGDNGCLSTSSGLRAERSSSAAVEAIVRDGDNGCLSTSSELRGRGGALRRQL